MLRVILEAFLLVSTLGSIRTLPLEPHLTLSQEWNGYYHADTSGPGSYSFGYDLEDAKSGNVQYRVEEKYPNGTVKGSYGLVEPDGNIKVVKYVADELGYRATVEDTNQKHPRHHPPLTSRTENERDSETSIQTPSFVHSFASLSQSIQEIRTPPKYQNSWPDNILGYDSLSNLD